jgi:ABC-type branched-subunit amino acid transport system substrate-binding protein
MYDKTTRRHENRLPTMTGFLSERRHLLKTLGVAGTCGVSGCTGLLADSATPSVDIGILSVLSSDAIADIGEGIANAARLPLTQLADADVDVRVDHRTKDTEGDVAVAVSAAESLVADGYPAVVGPLESELTLAVAKQVLIPEHVVGCSPTATSPRVTELDDDDYIFRTRPSDAFQASVQALVAIGELGAETAATMYVTDAYGTAFNDTFVSRFRTRGGSVQTQAPIDEEQDTYSAKLETALAANPDVLVLPVLGDSGITILQNYYDAHEGHDIMLPGGMKFQNIMKEVDGSLSNVFGTGPLPAGPNLDAFRRRYQQTYQRDVSVAAPHSYDASVVLALASLAADTTDSEIEDNIRSVAGAGGQKVGPSSLVEGAQLVLDGEPVEYVGASSPVLFDSNGDVTTATYEIWKYDPPNSFQRVDTISFDG